MNTLFPDLRFVYVLAVQACGYGGMGLKMPTLMGIRQLCRLGDMYVLTADASTPYVHLDTGLVIMFLRF
jgi:hypothetical protein